MHLILFSIVAICIAGSRTQEIAIATEYLRAHFNGSLSSESAINAQVPAFPPVVFGTVSSSSTTTGATTTTTTAGTTKKAGTTTTTTTTTTTAGTTKKAGKAGAHGSTTSSATGTTHAHDESSENDDDKPKSYDHEHNSHHEHDATITVDVHNVLDLFKQELHETEERILAAIHHGHKDNHSTSTPIAKSYRTADR